MKPAQIIPASCELGGATMRLAVAAYLARFEGQSRIHTESDLRAYLSWCDGHGLDPSTRDAHTWSCT